MDVPAFLSDVHLDKVADKSEILQYTRFKFLCSPSGDGSTTDEEDDDLKVDRIRSSAYEWDVIGIHHQMSTELGLVGAQVWRGALFMADYVLENPHLFEGKHCLELGSGTGLLGVVLSQFTKTLCCTDYNAEVLRLCRRNLDENKRFQRHPDGISVSKLDWLETPALFQVSLETSVLVAADCVYDNDLTDALFETILRTVKRLLSATRNSLICYFSMEKRYNFSATELKVVCNEYDHFCQKLFALKNLELIVRDGLKVNFTIEEIEGDSFKQYFCYERTAELEIWCVTVSTR